MGQLAISAFAMTLRTPQSEQVGPYTFALREGKYSLEDHSTPRWGEGPDCLTLITDDGFHCVCEEQRPAHTDIDARTKVSLPAWLARPAKNKLHWATGLLAPVTLAIAQLPLIVCATSFALPAWLYLRQRTAQQRVLAFHLGAAARQRYETIRSCHQALARQRNTWRVNRVTNITIPGLYTLARAGAPKESVEVGSGLPRSVTSNFAMPFLKSASGTLYLAPHALIEDRGGVFREIGYDKLRVSSSKINLRDENAVPFGAVYRGKTWRHITRDGNPDPLHADNPSFPVVAYILTKLAGPDGFEACFLTLRSGPIDALLAALTPPTSPDRLANQTPTPETPKRSKRAERKRRRRAAEVRDPVQAKAILVHQNRSPLELRTPPQAAMERAAVLPEEPIVVWAPRMGTEQKEVPIPGADYDAIWADVPDFSYGFANDVDPGNAGRPDAPSEAHKPNVTPAYPGQGRMQTKHVATLQAPTDSSQVQHKHYRWVPKDEQISVGGLNIPGGMLYVSEGLPGGADRAPPYVIDVSAAVHRQPVAIDNAGMDYWPNYSTITPQARRGYLQWLEGGRRAGDADVGYAFLYFYGLERRILVNDPAAPLYAKEVSDLADELRGMIATYGQSQSFRQYGVKLLNYLLARQLPEKLYLEAPPVAPADNSTFPFPLAVGLGQLARDGQPMRAPWALAWVTHANNIAIKPAAARYPALFATLFTVAFDRAYPSGMELRGPPTPLELNYQAACAEFAGARFSLDLGDLHNVTLAPKLIERLQQVVDQCNEALGPYDRQMAKATGESDRAAAILLLPHALWPSHIKEWFRDIRERSTDSPISLPLHEMTRALGLKDQLGKEEFERILQAAHRARVGIEPVAISPKRMPERVHLYRIDEAEDLTKSDIDQPKLTLALACAVALGEEASASTAQQTLAGHYFNAMQHLSATGRRQLAAYFAARCDMPPTFGAVAKKLADCEPDLLQDMALFAVHFACANGKPGTMTMNRLTKLYGAVNMAPTALVQHIEAALPGDMRVLDPGSDVPLPKHQSTTDGKTNLSVSASTIGGTATPPEHCNAAVDSIPVNLDPQRIALIQQETENAAGLLASVFADHDAEPASTLAQRDEPRSASNWRLSPGEAALLHQLVRQPSWDRTTLLQSAKEHHVMLDAALDAINDACIERFERPLTDGHDPVEVDMELTDLLPL